MDCSVFGLALGLIGLCYVELTTTANSFLSPADANTSDSNLHLGLDSSNQRLINSSTQENQSVGREQTRKQMPACKWKTTSIKCNNQQLDLSSVGCENDDVATVKHSFNKRAENESRSQSNCSEKISSEHCQMCREFDSWSDWSDCCLDDACSFRFGNYSKYRKVRYRNVSSDCRKTFEIGETCSYQISHGVCFNKTGRAGLLPNDASGGNGNKATFSLTTKLSIFSIAGVIMVGLFGFAGLRLMRTIGRQPSHRRNSRLSTSRQSCNQNDSQYSNASFREDQHSPHHQDQQFLMVNSSRSQRGAPSFSRLSIIQEEDDALSVSVQEETPHASETASVKPESNQALDYMDDVINQMEDDEKAMQVEDGDFRLSIAREESFKLMDQFGWDPEARKMDPDRIERLKPIGDNETLINSDLSLASATLLQQRDNATSCATSRSTSSLTESDADCYSLRDISDPDSPNIGRRFASEPDLTKSKHIIPNIDDVLTDSDYDVHQKNVCV